MLKKSRKYSGYIFLESLVALSLMCIVVGSYFYLNTFLLQKNKEETNKLIMVRVLYEELKHFSVIEGLPQREVSRENKSYQLRFKKLKNELIEVEITDGKERFTIKKEIFSK